MENDDFLSMLSGKKSADTSEVGSRLLAVVKDFTAATQVTSAVQGGYAQNGVLGACSSFGPPNLDADILTRFPDLPELWLIGSGQVLADVTPQARPGVYLLLHPAMDPSAFGLGETTGAPLTVGRTESGAFIGEPTQLPETGHSHLPMHCEHDLHVGGIVASGDLVRARHSDTVPLRSGDQPISIGPKSEQHRASMHVRPGSLPSSCGVGHSHELRVDTSRSTDALDTQGGAKTPPTQRLKPLGPLGQTTAISDAFAAGGIGRASHDPVPWSSETGSLQMQSASFGGQAAEVETNASSVIHSPFQVDAGCQPGDSMVRFHSFHLMDCSSLATEPTCDSQGGVPGPMVANQSSATPVAESANGSGKSPILEATSSPMLPQTTSLKNSSRLPSQFDSVCKPGRLPSATADSAAQSGLRAPTAYDSGSEPHLKLVTSDSEPDHHPSSSPSAGFKQADPAPAGPEAHPGATDLVASTSYEQPGQGPAAKLSSWPSVVNALQVAGGNSPSHLLSVTFGQPHPHVGITPPAFGSLSLPQPALAASAIRPMPNIPDPPDSHTVIHIHH